MRCTKSHAEARRRGVGRCFQFSILHLEFISHRARRGRRANVTTSYFTLHTSDFGGMSDWLHFILSTAYFRLRCDGRLVSLHTFDFTLPTLYGVIPCGVRAPGAWNLRGVPYDYWIRKGVALCYCMSPRWGYGMRPHPTSFHAGCHAMTLGVRPLCALCAR